MIQYQKIDTTTNPVSNVGSPGDLPQELVGLSPASLANLDWVDPSRGFTGVGYVAVVVPDPVIVPTLVSRMQLKQQMLTMPRTDGANGSLLEQANSTIQASGNTALQVYWDDTSDFHRDHPAILSMGVALNLSNTQIDQAFISASQFA